MKIRKISAMVLALAVLLSLTGCGKNSTAEESMQAEIESLRAQLAEEGVTETSDQDDDDPADDEDETDEVTATAVDEETGEAEDEDEEEDETTYPFDIQKNKNNMALGEIAEYGDAFVGLADVREFASYSSLYEGSYSFYDLPTVGDGQVVIHPIIQIYNPTDEVLEYDDQIISLYADNVQVTRAATSYSESYWVDGIEELIYTDLDPNETSVIVSAFNVDENWSTLTIFYGDVSWTVTRGEFLVEPYTYTSMFNQEDEELTEPGSVVFRNEEYELIFDGIEIYSEGLRMPHLLFEYTINNLTDSILQVDTLEHMRGYYEHRLLESPNSMIDATVSGYNNAGRGPVEIHPGMSSKIYFAFPVLETEGTFEMYFETQDDGVVAHVASEITG